VLETVDGELLVEGPLLVELALPGVEVCVGMLFGIRLVA